MSSKETPAETAPAKAEEPVELTVQEFCLRLSVTDRRVELIAAFAHAQRGAGVIKRTEAEFARAFSDFANQPTL